MVHKLPLCLCFLLSMAPAHAQTIELSVSDPARAAWPFIGQVSHGYDRLGLCTGTLIAPDKVLTAAHCVVNPKSGKIAPFHRIRFRAGLHEGDETASSFAKTVAVHPGYLDRVSDKGIEPLDLFEYDVALVTLKHPMAKVAPAQTSVPIDASGDVSVVGYQRGSNNTLIDYIGCAVNLQDTRFLGLSCTVKPGTSGGPVLKRTDGEWRVVGVVVAAASQKNTDIKGVAVRVDLETLPSVFPNIFP
ncbi:MAG: trypsin-like peptidase domain-containing protein [Pseudomonadota bacterium]